MKVLQRSSLGAMVALALCAATPSHAGPYADALAMCLVKSTTSQDKTALVQWMFATASLHPDVKRLSAARKEDRVVLNKRFAGLVESLLTKSCVAETKAALKYEGNSTLESSFNVLGQVASRELFSNPAVASGMAEMTKEVDSNKLQEVLGGN